jgi:hypothetical protein
MIPNSPVSNQILLKKHKGLIKIILAFFISLQKKKKIYNKNYGVKNKENEFLDQD